MKCEETTLPDGRPAARVELPIDPATLSTAQQKKIDFGTRRVFANRRVASGMKAVERLAAPFAASVRRVAPPGSPVFLFAEFLHAYPKGAPAKKRIDNAPMPSGADNDNRIKAPQDALVKAGWFPDDRFVTTTVVTKRRTTGSPRIVLTVATDR